MALSENWIVRRHSMETNEFSNSLAVHRFLMNRLFCPTRTCDQPKPLRKPTRLKPIAAQEPLDLALLVEHGDPVLPGNDRQVKPFFQVSPFF